MNPLTQRGTIFLDDEATVLAKSAFAGEQYVLRIQAPRCAARATPGSFVHVTCDAALPMRRPLSIMRAHAEQGWIEILFKVTGHGSRLLAQRAPQDRISVLGPIGVGFRTQPERPLCVLIGGGIGIPPMIFLAQQLAKSMGVLGADQRPEETAPAPKGASISAVAFFGSEIPFPFRSRPSTLLAPEVPSGVIAAAPLLESWGIPSRLASLSGFPGCFEGYVTELAAHYLERLDADRRAQVQLFACGPNAMLRSVARLARRFDVPAQVSLEEFMACAVGGCAGCTVRVMTPEGAAMKRVCVDGPVFTADAVFAHEA